MLTLEPYYLFFIIYCLLQVLTLESAEAQQAGMSNEKKENFFEQLLELLYSADVKVGVALKRKKLNISRNGVQF